MSTDEEVLRISKIISEIIKKIDFGRDLDKTLNVLTTARGLFINLDNGKFVELEHLQKLPKK